MSETARETPLQKAQRMVKEFGDRVAADPGLKDAIRRGAERIFPGVVANPETMGRLIAQAMVNRRRMPTVITRDNMPMPNYDDVLLAHGYAAELAIRAAQQMVVSLSDDATFTDFRHCLFADPDQPQPQGQGTDGKQD